MNKKVLITTGIILGLAVIAGGFLVWQNGNNKQQAKNSKQQERQISKQEKNNQENQKDEIEELKVENIDTSNWKEYCNKEYGFCVKYPEGWKVEKEKKRFHSETGKIVNEDFSLRMFKNDNQNERVIRNMWITVMKLPKNLSSVKQLIKNNNYLHEYILTGVLDNGIYSNFNGQEFFIAKSSDYLIAITIDPNKKYWYLIEVTDPTGLRTLDEECMHAFYGSIYSLKFFK